MFAGAGGSVVGRRFAGFAYLAICGLAWLSAVLFYVKQGDRSPAYLGYGAFAGLLTLTLPRAYGWYQGSFWRSVLTTETLRGCIGPTTLRCGADGLEEIGPIASARGAWRDVMKVERDAERIFVYLAPLIVVVVPAAAFADDAAFTGFERDLTARVAAARAKTE